MALLDRMLQRMTAIYWALQSTESGGIAYDDHGEPLYSTPIQIQCRWEDVAEEVIDEDGTLRKSRSKVYVDRDVVVGGVLMLGTLDSGIEDDPRTHMQDHEAWEIIKFDKKPDLRVKRYCRKAYL